MLKSGLPTLARLAMAPRAAQVPRRGIFCSASRLSDDPKIALKSKVSLLN